MKKLLLILSLTLLPGCASFKKDVGDYVSAAVVESVEKKMDEKLSARGLSVAEITSAISNGTGKITPADTIIAARDFAKEAALIEAKKLIDERVDSARKDMDSHGRNVWGSLIVLFGTGLASIIGKHLKDHSRFKKIEDAIFGAD